MAGESDHTDTIDHDIIKLLEMLTGRRATMAMFCKTAVARKVLVHAWKHDISLANSEIHPIDAAVSFGAAVDACLLVCSLSPASHYRDCRVYRCLGDPEPIATLGYHDGQLVADVSAFERWRHLEGGNEVKQSVPRERPR